MSLVLLGIYVQFTIYNNVRTYISRYPIVYTSIHVVSDCRCVLGALSRGGKLCCVVVDPGYMYQSLVTGPEMNRHLRVRPQAFLCTNRINSKQRKLFKLAGDKKWRTEFFMTKEKQWVNKSCTEIMKYAFQPRQHKIAQFQMVLVFSFL